MSEFELYLRLGIDHILDLNAYDHIVFIIALHAVYTFKEWKKVIILITSFTIGHSITLVLSAFDIIPVNTKLIEFLIPVTIFITSIYNIFDKNEKHIKKIRANYFLALIFGLIHGMGFSSYFKSLMGMEENVVMPLFAFNIGVEIGQLFIVAFILFLLWLIVDKFKAKQREWNLFISSGTAAISLMLMTETAYFL